MIMCVLLCSPVSFHMLQLLLTGCPISSLEYEIYEHPFLFYVKLFFFSYIHV